MRVFFYVKIYAFLSVSINHIEYFKGKYGILYTENILRKGVQILQESAKEDVPVELELYIQQLKEAFRKKGEEEDLPFSSSIGAIYNNTIGKENIDELIDRCGKMRLLNEKHAEAEFSEGKMKML